LSAALAAAHSGATVPLVDDSPLAGGQVWRQGPSGRVARPLQTLLDTLCSNPNVTLFAGTRIVAALSSSVLLAESVHQDGCPRPLRVAGKRLILATTRSAGARVLAVVERAHAGSVSRFALSLAMTPSKAMQAARAGLPIAGTGPTASCVRRVVNRASRL
jgi:D-hydroxyproline dehydrogenase subunit alpha